MILSVNCERDMTLRSFSIDRNSSSPRGVGSPHKKDVNTTVRSPIFKRSKTPLKMANNRPGEVVTERSLSFKNWEAQAANAFHNQATVSSAKDVVMVEAKPMQSPKPEFTSPRPLPELNTAATTLQKVYKSYRTRRNLADCAVVVEELWWKALDFASLNHSSVSFFKVEKPETTVSRWGRAGRRIAKVGKGLSKDEKAKKLALQHWLEAIDPRHRYGHNLHLYYDIWSASESTEPFFYWLDVGAGRDMSLEKCPRTKLQNQLVMYLGPNERMAYEVTVENGKLIYIQSKALVNTTEDSKWIFVLSTSRTLYIGQKQKGKFQHSSFLAGAATTAAGRLVAKEGILKAIWPYSGHYLPTEENFKEFISFLEENNVDLSDVKKCSVDDDEYPSFKKTVQAAVQSETVTEVAKDEAPVEVTEPSEPAKELIEEGIVTDVSTDKPTTPEVGSRLSCKWSSGIGARIGCVRDYPFDLQCKALEQVNLSPRLVPSPSGNKIPIPSPRPSPKVRLSPRLQYMGIPTPNVSLTLPKLRSK